MVIWQSYSPNIFLRLVPSLLGWRYPNMASVIVRLVANVTLVWVSYKMYDVVLGITRLLFDILRRRS